ncbi:MAG: RNA polymerase sigma factor [Saprospiraceae bacterium]|nr:RNA polymerase sigma factor [Saprospiraceae bacterium]
MASVFFSNDILRQTNFLRNFAMQLTKDPESASDLYQETMYRAIKNEHRFIPGSNLKAWLSTIMKNLFINMYRKKKRENIVREKDDSNFSYAEFFAGTESNLGESAIMIKEIYKRIDALNEDFGTPVKLMLNGMKYEEISEELNIPIGTVKSRLHQARKDLQSKIMKDNNVQNHFELN